MKDKSIISKIHSTKQKSLDILSKAIAKLIIRLRLSRSDFLMLLDKNLVKEAKKQDPHASNVTLAIRTGISRRYINNYLYDDISLSKPDKLSVIFDDIKWTANNYYHSRLIPIKGPVRTIQSICEIRASGTLTYKSILLELVKQGLLKVSGNKAEILDSVSMTLSQEADYSEIISHKIELQVGTYLHNYDNINSDDNMFITETISTTKVNPENFKLLHSQIKTKTEEFEKDISLLLTHHEEDTDESTYPAYGISLLEYSYK